MFQQLTPDQLQALVDAIPDPVWLLDAQGNGLAANAAGVALAGSQSQLTSDHPLLATPGADNSLIYRNADEREFHFYIVQQPLGEGLQVRIFRDVSEEVRLTHELAEQSLKDPATGLLNERGLMVALEPQVSRSRRYQNPLSVVKMNLAIDSGNNELRRKISHVLKDQLRWADLIGCGGTPNDFIMVLPETEQEDALRITDKLQTNLHQQLGNELRIAYGVAAWQKQDNTQTLLNRVDSALQQAIDSNQAHVAIAG